jgi:hypothetical protein
LKDELDKHIAIGGAIYANGGPRGFRIVLILDSLGKIKKGGVCGSKLAKRRDLVSIAL